jgi:hypothetical protein
MLVFAGILAMSSFALEMVIAAKLPVWQKFAERYLLANMGLSWNFDSELALRQGGNRLRYIWNESKLRLSHRIATAKQWCLLLIV